MYYNNNNNNNNIASNWVVAQRGCKIITKKLLMNVSFISIIL